MEMFDESDEMELNVARHLLVLHDEQIALRAKVDRLVEENNALKAELAGTKHMYETSLTWQVGAIITAPLKLLWRPISRLFTRTPE